MNLDLLIENQKNYADAAWRPFKALLDKYNAEFEAKVNLEIQNVSKRAKFSPNFLSDLLDGSGSVELYGDNGERLFASGFDMYFHTHCLTDHKPRLALNCGTSGSFTRDDTVQMDRYKMLSVCIEHLAEWEDYLASAVEKLKPLKTAYSTIDNELSSLLRTKEKLEEDKKMDALVAAIQIGKVYLNARYCQWRKDVGYKGYKYVKFVGFTEKSANLEVGYYTKEKEFKGADTYRMKKEDFIKAIKYKSLYEVEM